jgi:hypothetical protein
LVITVETSEVTTIALNEKIFLCIPAHDAETGAFLAGEERGLPVELKSEENLKQN